MRNLTRHTGFFHLGAKKARPAMTTTDAHPGFKPRFSNGVTLPEPPEVKGATLYALTLAEIPLLTKFFGDKKCVSIPFYILKVAKRGFARVPQEENRGKYTIPEGAQYLTEICSGEDHEGNPVDYAKCYAFETLVGLPRDKGPRVNDCTHELWYNPDPLLCFLQFALLSFMLPQAWYALPPVHLG